MINSNKDMNYLKIGTFVLIGFGLMIFALLIFGSDKLFQRVVHIETYFEESVQGVSNGTQVKYRGLQVGHVETLSFVGEVYKRTDSEFNDPYARSIYVQIAITSEMFTQFSNEKLKRFLEEEVKNGLRIKLVPQGLTGTSCLELDYVKKPKDLSNIAWKPKYFYVPSTFSTLTKLSENVQHIVNEVKDIDFKKMLIGIENLTNSLEKVANKTERVLNQIDVPLVEAIRNFKAVSEDLKMLSKRVKLKPSDIVFSSYPSKLDLNKL